jgi:hypothetical protein
MGAHIWNELPTKTIKASSLCSFKNKLKLLLLNRYKDDKMM